MSAQQTLELNRESLLPFLPLMQGGNQELVAGARRLGQVSDPQKRREMNLHFLFLGGLRYNRDKLIDLIWRESMIPIEQLRESSFYQYILEEGREEGLQRRLREGEVALLRRLLEHRFGPTPEWALKKIDAADHATLGRWAVLALDAATLEAVLGEA
jgi:predicted transposase YdaD